MMYPSYTIEKLYALHKAECPDSQLSKRAIRQAVADGSLPSVKIGNRHLIRVDVFEKWQGGSNSKGVSENG